MAKRGFAAFTAALIAAAVPVGPAAAKVERADDTSFVIVQEQEIAASPAALWAVLVTPARWWSAEHSWSGDAANFRMTPVPGGCFCEALPAKKGDSVQQAGFVEHARIIYAKPGEMLRLSGVLGPLQSEALTGTLSFTLAPGQARGTTKLKLEYVVGGASRIPLKNVAPVVDKVLGEQMARLQAATQAKPVR